MLKNIDETRNYVLQELEQKEWISRKHKKACTALNYFEHCLILAPRISDCISISVLVL